MRTMLAVAAVVTTLASQQTFAADQLKLAIGQRGLWDSSFAEIGMQSAADLFSTYAGSAEDMKPWLQDAQINRDRNLRLQYLAGRSLNVYRADAIFAQMLPYAKEPEGIFEGSEASKETLRGGTSVHRRR